MGVFNDEDIKGYKIAEQNVCRKCVTAKEESEANQDELIIDIPEDVHIFCDRRKERIV